MDSIFYAIDLDTRRLAITEFEGEELKKDMAFFKVQNALDLNTFDRKIFKHLKQAEIYLAKYEYALKNLNNKLMRMDLNYHPDDKFPCVIYKRRYIVQSLLGEKTYTTRTWNLNIQVGELFNLFDQTYFLTVKMKKITKIDNYYKYEFERVLF